MTPTQFRAILARLGLSQSEAARRLDVDSRTVRRWASGSSTVPALIERVLLACDADPAMQESLLAPKIPLADADKMS